MTTLTFKTILSAVRTPLLLWGGIALFLLDKRILPNLTLMAHYLIPVRAAYGTLDARFDYFFFLPNVVTYLTYLFLGFALVEVKLALVPEGRNGRWDAVTALVGLAVALSACFWMKNMKPGFLQFLLTGAQVGSLWVFWMVNANPSFLSPRFRKRWVARFLNWTFPISDILFYMPHRKRLGPQAGWLRFIPTSSIVLLIALGWGLQGRILLSSKPAEKIPVPVLSCYWAQMVDGGFWFSNADWWDPQSGIWYYDERARSGHLYIRSADTRRFYLDGGYFYLHDRYDDLILKVDAETREVVWKAPVKHGFGTFEVMLDEDRVIAEGEGGYFLVLNRDGQVITEREFPYRTWEPYALWDRSLAFVSGDPMIRIWNNRLTDVEEIPLPLPKGTLSFTYSKGDCCMRSITNMVDYAPDRGIFYVQTYWGEIFRFDVKQRKFLPSFKTDPGLRTVAVDSRNGLLFALNYFQGYIDVLDLESGSHLAYILANGRGRFINLDPRGMRGVVNTHGYGLYRFDYSDIVASSKLLSGSVPPSGGASSKFLAAPAASLGGSRVSGAKR